MEGDEEEEAGEEAHSPLEQDSLMPSDEASDSLSRGRRGSPCHRGGEEDEEEEEEEEEEEDQVGVNAVKLVKKTLIFLYV